MGKKGALAVIACVAALCLALVGCGNNDEAAVAKKAFAGTWDLVGMTQNGEEVGANDLAALKSLGLQVYVNLNEDGTAVLMLFDEQRNGTWEATSRTSAKVTLDNQEIGMMIKDSKLHLTQDASTLLFEKSHAKEEPASSSASS